MSLITRVCKQTCVYWAPRAVGTQGRMSLSDPVELACRWEDKTELFPVKNEHGEVETRTSLAFVYVLVDVQPKGYLWLGELADAPSDPVLDPNAYPIQRIAKEPNFRATEFLRSVWL